MIGRLTGALAEKAPPRLLIDVDGVGYEVDVPMSSFYNLPAVGERVTLLTHFVVREDAQVLYGFLTPDERSSPRKNPSPSLVATRTISPSRATTWTWRSCVDGDTQDVRSCCLTKECYPLAGCRFGSFFPSSIQCSKAVGMWSKAAAVGNAGCAAARCPRSQPVRRRRIVHMSIACRARSARPPVGREVLPRLFHTSAGIRVDLRSRPKIMSLARSARQALTWRCNVRSCALPA